LVESVIDELRSAPAMAMNIKDPRVHAMARELAARAGISVTEAVRRALAAELERAPAASPVAARAARLEAVHRISAAYRSLTLRDPRSSAELCADLYDEQGLPR
jgi:antitoxin VapB